MKILGIVLGVLAVIIAIVVAAVLFGISKLDDLVAQGIERGGSKLTGTEVTVESVDLSLRKGFAGIAGLSIGNPEGFQGEQALRWEDVSVRIDLASMRQPPMRLAEVKVRGPEVFFELDADGSSNLDKIRRSVERWLPEKGESEGEDRGKDIRMAVTSFVIEEGALHADATAVGGERYDLELPALELQDIGGREGVPPEQIGQEVLVEISRQSSRAVTEQGIDALVDEHLSGEAGEQVKELLSGLRR